MQSKRRNIAGRTVYRLQPSPGKAPRSKSWTSSLRSDCPNGTERASSVAEQAESTTSLMIVNAADAEAHDTAEEAARRHAWPPGAVGLDGENEANESWEIKSTSPLWKQMKIDKILASDQPHRDLKTEVSSEDIMAEFYIAVAECQQLNHQVTERDQRISKMTHVLSSMESALIASEKQRAIAEQSLEAAHEELAALKCRLNNSEREHGQGLNSELRANSAKGSQLAERVKSMKTILQKLSKSEIERDDARAQLHSALNLLERQSKITAAIGEAEGLTRSNQASTTSSSALATAKPFQSLQDEVKALRMGSDLASKCRQEYADLAARNKELADQVQQMEVQLALAGEASSQVEPKHETVVALEQQVSTLRDELEAYQVRERCLVQANQDMERKLSAAHDELAEKRARSMHQTEQSLALEHRAAAAESALQEVQQRAALSEQQKALLAAKANSLERFQNHVCSVAQAYASPDWLPSQRTSYEVGSVLTKFQHFSLSESGPQPSLSSRKSTDRPKWKMIQTYRKGSEPHA